MAAALATDQAPALALDQAEAPAPIQARIVGKVAAADDNSIRIGSYFYKLSKTKPYSGPALTSLVGREVSVTYSPWSSPDGSKNYRYIDLITQADDQAAPPPPPATAQPPQELAAKASAASQGPNREYLMARMSALKAAVHLGAQTGATSEDCLAVAERYLAWLYQAS